MAKFNKCSICKWNDEYEGCENICLLYSGFELSIEKAKKLAESYDISLSDLFVILNFMENN